MKAGRQEHLRAYHRQQRQKIQRSTKSSNQDSQKLNRRSNIDKKQFDRKVFSDGSWTRKGDLMDGRREGVRSRGRRPRQYPTTQTIQEPYRPHVKRKSDPTTSHPRHPHHPMPRTKVPTETTTNPTQAGLSTINRTISSPHKILRYSKLS